MKHISYIVVLACLVETGVFADSLVYTGTNGGHWEVSANWSPAQVPTLADTVLITARTVRVAATAEAGSLVISNGTLSINGLTTAVLDRRTADATRTDPVGLTVAGSLVLKGSAGLAIGGLSQRCPSLLSVGGDLVLTNTASLAVYPGETNDAVTFQSGGASLSIAGSLELNPGTWVHAYCHQVTNATVGTLPKATGAPAVFDVGSLVVRTNAGFNANGRGYIRNSTCPSGDSGGAYVGGGYGGRGGSNSGTVTNGRPPFGHAWTPYYPGGPGGNGPSGGGAIRIHAGSILLEGTLTANGANGGYSGGGAGGGIWLTCGSFTAADTALLSARGGLGGTGSNSGGGSGGRVAVGIGLTSSQISALYQTDSAADLYAVPLAQVLHDRLAVSGSLGANAGTAGEEGSGVWYINRAESFVLEIAGNPDFAVEATPGYGSLVVAGGTPVDASVNTPAFVNAAHTSRRLCAGYAVTNAAGTVLASGSGSALTGFVVNEDAVLTWDWQPLQHLLVCEAGPGGDVSTAGGWHDAGTTTEAFTAVPDSGYEFLFWTGDVPDAQRTNAVIVLTMNRPRLAKAWFGSATGTVRAWKGGTGSWFNSANWTPEGVPGRLDSLWIGTNVASSVLIEEIAVASNLTLSGNSTLRIASGGTGTNVLAQASLHTNAENAVGLLVHGDLTVGPFSRMSVGGANMENAAYLTVQGDLQLTNATLAIYAGPTNDQYTLRSGSSRVAVGGSTFVEDKGWLYPVNDYRFGGGVFFDLGDLTVGSTNAGFNASVAGYKNYVVDQKTYCNVPGGLNTSSYSGGSHGGRGGANSAGNYTVVKIYGLTNTPIHPGGPGHNNNTAGGGTIRIHADDVVLNGVLRAEGGYVPLGGGSAGGGIWMTCSSFTPGDSALVSVRGGNCTGASNGGGGGGGRASICVGLDEGQINVLLEGGEVENAVLSLLADVLQTRFTAAGGSGYGNGNAGEPGSGVWIVNRAGNNLVTVTGDPEPFGTVDPPYGPNSLTSGGEITFSAVSPVSVSADNRSRRVCSGYTVTNLAGETVASGAGTNGSVFLDNDLVLTWNWTALEHRFEAGANGQGSILTNAIPRPDDPWQPHGGTLSLTAVPEPGHEFLVWNGEIEGACRTNAELVLTHDRPRTIVAVFATAASGAKTWTGAGDGAGWYDGANWDPAGVPGRLESILIDTGTVSMCERTVAEVASLTIGSNAFLRIGGEGATAVGQDPADPDSTETVGLTVVGDLVLEGQLAVGGAHQKASSVLSVGGDLTVKSGSALAVYAGYGDPSNTATYAEGGAKVTVAGMTALETNGWIYPRCDGLSGAPVVFHLGDARVDAGGGFNADARGYYWTNIAGILYYHGPGSSYGNMYAAGSHGGLGGNSALHAIYGTVYGSPNAPFRPGSPGGNAMGATAGGAIRIRAADFRLDGTLTANGNDIPFGLLAGAGAGGAIWVTCDSFHGSPSAVVSVRGGHSAGGGAGGGGRAAFGVRLTGAQIASLYETGEADNLFRNVDLLDPGAGRELYLPGILSVEGGTTTASGSFDGQPGTARFLSGPPFGTLIILR